jgi:hypothetical protein
MNWILAPFFVSENMIGMIETFSSANTQAFIRLRIAPLSTEWTNILLYGFWGQNHFALP